MQPLELALYWQNTFEVPWMVVNAGVRIDAVTSQSFSEEDNHQVGDNENEKDERDL